MIEDRDLFERAAQRFAPPESSFDRLVARRDRKRRNERIGAGVVGITIAVALAVALGSVGLLRSGPPTPANQTAPPRSDEIVMMRGFAWRDDTNPELVAIDPGTGAVRTLVTCDQECGFSPFPWSPSGRKLLYSNGGSLFEFDFESEVSRSVVSGRAVGAIYSPDGRRIMYDAGTPPKTPTDFHLIASDGTGDTTLDPLAGMNLLWAEFSPDGRSIAYFDHSVYFADGAIGILDLDGDPTARTLVTFPRQDPCNTPSAPIGCVHSVTMSPADGRIAYTTYDPKAGVDTLRVIDPDDGAIALVARWSATSMPLGQRIAWSPDGSRIAYATGCQIWSIAPDGTDPALLHDLGTCTSVPDGLTWSSDGREIAFIEVERDVQGTPQSATLSVLPLDGPLRRLGTFAADDGGFFFAWGPSR